jgi:hypothetical protein
VFSLGKRNVKAHRLVYSLLVGDPGPGIDLDHVCRTTLCVNPDHLDPVTITVNNERTTGFRQRSTHCPRGHRYSEHGRLQDGYPACRICDTDRHRERRN